MKLKNKKTGEIVEVSVTLAELNAEWEDYEESKEWWYIDIHGPHKVINNDKYYQKVKDASKEIGNYFETKEEAEKAVERLRAWKRLKDAGFRLSAVVDTFFCIDIFMKGEPYEVIKDDLKIVFGGEE